MGDLYLKDSKNRYHQVCIQMYNTSCGPACVAMVERIFKHLSRSDETRARDLMYRYPGYWTNGGSSWPWDVSRVLNSEGVPTYQATNVGYAGVYSYLKCYACFRTPVVAGLRWFQGGGHFTMCAIADADDTFVFYDPWYGIVELKGYQFPYYTAPDGASGYLDGWLVITHH